MYVKRFCEHQIVSNPRTSFTCKEREIHAVLLQFGLRAESYTQILLVRLFVLPAFCPLFYLRQGYSARNSTGNDSKVLFIKLKCPSQPEKMESTVLSVKNIDTKRNEDKSPES